MNIADRRIAHDASPYIIAEIGVNHDGSLDKAIALIDAAAAAGADAVKVQYFSADRLVGPSAPLAHYQARAHEHDAHSMLKRLELPLDAMARIVQHAHARQLHAIVTVFSTELVPDAATLAWDAFKSASPDIIHRPLLRALASTARPLIISTGAATAQEVARALIWLSPFAHRLAMLHCVSAYPVPPEHAALGAIAALGTMFDGPVGYSDHTTLVETGALAVATGAALLEKHLTLDRHALGPDHAASLEPAPFAQYVAQARRAHTMFGPSTKQVLACERDVRAVARQSIVAARPLVAGLALSRADLTVCRPGGGLEPWMLDQLLGQILAVDLNPGDLLSLAHLLPHPQRSAG
jgi:N-acetylneuraminate synthase/N,N'-diacetyllegionaminate synthase